MKKFGLISIFSLIAAVSFPCLHASDAFDDLFGDDFHIVTPEEAGAGFTPLSAGAASPVDVLDILQNLQILKAAQIGLYKVTSYTSKRDVLDLPAIYTTIPLRNDFQCNIFFNTTPKLFFTRNGDSLDDLTTLDEFADFITDFDQSLLPSEINIPQYLALFRGGFAEERRIGLLFQGFYVTPQGFILGGRLPFYYVERNWNFSPDAQKQLKELASASHASAAPSAQDDYLHLVVNDALGFGDLRLIGSYLAYETDRFKTIIGADITFPSAFALKRGLIGGDMENSFVPQVLDLTEIVTQALANPQSQYLVTVAQDFGENAIKQLGAIGLATVMGMQDPALAVFLNQHIEAMRGVRFFGSLRIAGYLPRTRPWYFNEIKDPAAFNPANFEFNAGQEAEAQLQIAFLENVLLNNYFPPRYDTHFKSRTMVEALAGVNFDVSNNWEFFGGYDLWFFNGDKVEYIYKGQTQFPLNIAAAQRSNAVQNKFFGGITYTSFREAVDIEASLMFDQTFASQSIGQDTTINLQIAWYF